MYTELREQAKKKVEAKMSFYISAVVFAGVSVVLLMLSYQLPSIGFWLKLPIPILIMVLVTIYLNVFGIPRNGAHSENWKEDEIEKEMIKLYRQKRLELSAQEELTETESLELEELEYLENRPDSNEDFV